MKNPLCFRVSTGTAGRLFGVLAIVLCLSVCLGPFHPARALSSDEYFSKAVSRYVNHQHEKARRLLRKALTLNPQHGNARRLYRELGGELPLSDTVARPLNAPDTASSSSPPKPGPKAADTEPSGSVEPDVRPGRPDAGGKIDDTGETGTAGKDAAHSPPDPDRSEVFANSGVDEEAGIPSITGLKVLQYPNRVTLKLKATRPIDVIVSRIQKPPVLVLDVPGARDRLPPSPFELNMDPVIRIRHNRFRDHPFPTTRLALDLSTPRIAHRLRQTRSQRQIVIDVLLTESGEVKKKSPDSSTTNRRSEPSTSP